MTEQECIQQEIAHLQRGERPLPVSYGVRTVEHLVLFEEVLFNGVYQRRYSRPFDCFGYEHFTLFLHILSVGTDDHVICLMPQFSDYGRGEFCDYAQGLFAALCFEDVDTAAGLHQSFHGECAGRLFRLRAIETGTTTDYTFTVSATVEFWR